MTTKSWFDPKSPELSKRLTVAYSPDPDSCWVELNDNCDPSPNVRVEVCTFKYNEVHWPKDDESIRCSSGLVTSSFMVDLGMLKALRDCLTLWIKHDDRKADIFRKVNTMMQEFGYLDEDAATKEYFKRFSDVPQTPESV